MTFQDCHLITPIINALHEQGYTEPTAIQAGAIRPALAGRDILGTARTGTGKTCAFATPILQNLSKRTPQGKPIRALVLTPTRELAIQNQECFEAYGKYLNLKSTVIFGGVGQQPQVDALRQGVDILVATPGRLADLYQQGHIDLTKLEIFVLDEADRMLDMGFIHDVRRILKWLPAKKQTLFFSATMPPELTELVESLLHDPVHVSVDPVNTTVDAISQTVYKVDKSNKTPLLVQLLREHGWPSVLVFTRTKHGANKVARDLEKEGVTAAAIHGNKSQTARQAALAGFKAGTIRVLVATDLAARGLDIEDLTCVVNYNLPEVPETYVHRIGRTGRAGKDGVALSFCAFEELPLLKDIEKFTKKSIPETTGHPFPMKNTDPVVRDKHGRIVNAEDMEAREAARALAAQRREALRQKQEAEQSPKAAKSEKSEKSEQPAKPEKTEKQEKSAKADKSKKKSKQEAKADPKPVQSAPAEPVVESKPEKSSKKGKKQKKAADEPVIRSVSELFGLDIPDLLPSLEEEPPMIEERFDSADILHRKPKKPERRVVPSLSNVSLLPAFELKETFGSKLREDSTSFRLDEALDSTDRLFRTKPEKPAKAEKSEKSSKSEGKKSKNQPKAQAKEQPKEQSKKQKKADKPQPAPKAEQSPKSAKPVKQEKPAKLETPEKSEKNAKNGKKHHKADQKPASKPTQEAKAEQIRRPRPPFRPEERPSRVKDSTEQESLMKPYYLSDKKVRN